LIASLQHPLHVRRHVPRLQPRGSRIKKMLAGFKTLSVGLGLAIVPQIVSYISSFDFVSAFGLSPNAASVIGVAMIALRAVTSTPILSQKSGS
jgi:hypothetical protein